jgi:hypothetical protein
MSKQIHFVVCYDSETKRFEPDWEFTSDLSRRIGDAYDTETQEWVSVSMEDKSIVEAENALSALLQSS